MNEEQAKLLLDETFNKEFNISRFSNFLKELVNTSNLFSQDKSQFIPRQFKDYILGVTKIGQYKDNAGKSMELLAIKLAKHSSLERARTMQRNFIAKWLSNNPAEPEGAIVAFYDDEQDWRFSFVKLEYTLIKDDKGNLKGEKELTPAKRYSFLVGRNEPNHTCKKQFVDLLSDKQDPLFNEIENAFSIEKVTKEFFEKYKNLFLRLKESLQEVIEKNSIVKDEFLRIAGNDKGELEKFVVEFSKKLLGQIVFLYFLQKKGWLGVQKESNGKFKKWGTGPKDFMKRLFNKEYGCYNNFFNDILEYLFYDALARKRDQDIHKFNSFEFKIPFLNGGLFEPLDGYDWVNTNIYIENAIFEDIFKTFDEFNFTVKEDEPLEKEVAVDPEMLGKVFENLLGVIDRKSKGAFYTPREIVYYMCRQSLINYLETNTSILRGDIEKFIQLGDITISTNIRTLDEIKELEKKMISGFVSAEEFGKKIKEHSEKLDIPLSIVRNKEKIDNLLETIKVVDPAVGSGAFPIGMMNEIVKARSILSIFLGNEREVSDLKRHCVENSLYGVDIMPSAVDICQLRFWLSLIVDEDDKDKVKPLPNLDNKIMCGNSLLEEFEGVKLFDESLLAEEIKDIRPELDRIDKEIKETYLKIGEIERRDLKEDRTKLKREIKKLEKQKKELQCKPENTERNLTLGEIGKQKIKESKLKLAKIQNLQKKLFNEYDRDKKTALNKEIDKFEWDLIEVTLMEQNNEKALEKLEKIKKSKSKPFFLWKLYFSEVFQREDPGFDVVIANPPYLREKGNKEVFEIVNNSIFGKKYHQGKMDYWYYFLHKAIDIVRFKGNIAYITSRYWLNSHGSKKLINRIKGELVFTNFIDIGKLKVFDNVVGQHMIAVYKKDNLPNKFIYKKLVDNLDGINSNSNPPNVEIRTLNNDKLIDDGEIILQVDFINTDGTILLGDICNTSIGIQESVDKISRKQIENTKRKDIDAGKGVFVLTQKEVAKLGLNEEEKKIIKKYVDPNDIYRYSISQKNKKYIIYSDNLTKNKIAKDKAHVHIKSHLDNLNEFITSSNKPYGLHRPREVKYFTIPKIIFKGMFRKNEFCYDESRYFVGFSFSTIIQKDKNYSLKYILAILNSKLALHWFYKNGKLRGGGVDIGTLKLRKFPIKIISSEQQILFIHLVDQILSITKDDDYLDNPDKQVKVKRLEKEIDALVYKLYELTHEEIKIVEGFGEK